MIAKVPWFPTKETPWYTSIEHIRILLGHSSPDTAEEVSYIEYIGSQ